MEALISSSGPKQQMVIAGVSATVKPPQGERLSVQLQSLDSRSRIRLVNIGEAKDNGDLYLLLWLEDNTSQTIRINSEGLNICSSGKEILFDTTRSETPDLAIVPATDAIVFTEVPKDWKCYKWDRDHRMRCGSIGCPFKGRCVTEAI